MSQKGRILTLVVELQEDGVTWPWDAHLDGPRHGVKVLALADGNEIQRNEKLEKELEHADEQYGIGGQID